jgi:cysteinyl-tRNA synthetase
MNSNKEFLIHNIDQAETISPEEKKDLIARLNNADGMPSGLKATLEQLFEKEKTLCAQDIAHLQNEKQEAEGQIARLHTEEATITDSAIKEVQALGDKVLANVVAHFKQAGEAKRQEDLSQADAIRKKLGLQ